MGSVIKSPKPKPISLPPPPPPPPAPEVKSDEQTVEETQAQIRRAGLLSRARGRFGTVLNGFRGLEEKRERGGEQQGSKTLLGQ